MSTAYYRRRGNPALGLRTDASFVIHRLPQNAPSSSHPPAKPAAPCSTDDDDEEEDGDETLLASNKAEQERAKWKNWWSRLFWGTIMIALFTLIISSGHLALSLMVAAIQTGVFREVINLAHVKYREKRLHWFRTITWYFLFSTNYFLYGESLIRLFKDSVFVDTFLLPLAVHHRFISFCLYLFGLILFVLNLKKGHYKFQFNQFGLTHMTLLLVVCQSHFVIHNIFEGLIWFVLPVSLVILNDIMAYFFGFFLGRTPLIKLSPKKTWEGFIGAFLTTLMISFVFSGALARFPYLTCPASGLGAHAFSNLQCQPNPIFVSKAYTLPAFITRLLKHLGCAGIDHVNIYPIQWHALIFGVFASLIAPFGGFFASGFKRAFKIKDFADAIPGHGGLTDRMDCQFLMGLFVYLYYTSFLKYSPLTAGAVLQVITRQLTPSDQRLLYVRLQQYLVGRDLL